MHVRRHLLMDSTLGRAALGLPDDPATDPAQQGGGSPAPNPDGAKPDEALGDGGKSALEKERNARADADKRAKAEASRANTAEAELKKLKDQGLSEAERTQREAEENRVRAEKAEARALRLEVAAAKGLDLALAGRLQGSTQAELEADADQLKALLPAASAAAPKGPNPDRGQGAKPEPVKGGFDSGAAVARARYPQQQGGTAA